MVSLLNPEYYGENVPGFVQDYIQALERLARACDDELVAAPQGVCDALEGIEAFVQSVENAEPAEDANEGETPMLQEEPLESFLYPDDD